ncbi:MAG: response regulator [Hyphomicrobiales bacterium]|nr:response regulator [Hyphomicrobiales bacterium]MCP5370409.1 response regulator [Hyphomicrobiales bacterium]
MALEPELRRRLIATFKVDLDEQLQIVTHGLLALEKGPGAEDRNAAFANVMRAAHNIKGAARGIGMPDIGDIMHHLETLFSALAEGGGQVPGDAIDLALSCLDRAREATEAATEDGERPFDLDQVMADLQGAIVAAGGEPPKNRGKPPAANAASAPPPGAAAPAAPSPAVPAATPPGPAAAAEGRPAPGPRYASPSTDVVRVTVEKLDRLSALLEELQIAKIEIDEHVDAMQRLRVRTYEGLAAGRAVSGGAVTALAAHGPGLGVADWQTEVGRLYQDIRAKVGRFDIVLKSLQHDMRDLRLVTAVVLLQPLERSVRDIARELGKEISFSVRGQDVEADRSVFERLRDPIMHIVRNAIDHGIEAPDERRAAGKPERGQVSITVATEGSQLVVHITDDGAGLDPVKLARVAVKKKVLSEETAAKIEPDEILDLICRPGFSTSAIITDVSGRGVGMDAARASLQSVKGTLGLDNRPGDGATFTIRVPITLATEHALLVRAGGQVFALPITSVDRVMDLNAADIIEVEAGEAVVIDGESIPVRRLSRVLGLAGEAAQRPGRLPVAVISSGPHRVAAAVDEVIGQQEMVMAPLRPPLRSVRNVAGGTFTGRHGIVIVLNPGQVVETAMRRGGAGRVLDQGGTEANVRATRVLVVDDSLTTRTLEKNILENHGYAVEVAVNGEDAWERLRDGEFDLVVTDVEMPLLDGFDLTARIKGDDRFRELPVVIVTSLANDGDRQRGIEVGADAYVVKGEFETRALIDIVQRLV